MTTLPAPARRGEVTVAGLTWRPYGRAEPTLLDVTLALAPGERVLLVGASGSGKSTLLQALAGLLDDSLGEASGQVLVDGRVPGAEAGTVGLLLQDSADAVVAEHAGRDAAFGPENRAWPPDRVRAAATAALDAVGFPYGAERPTTALSGGESARLALAGALALGPALLLLDEPTAMLDATAAAVVRTAVEDVARAAGLAVVVVEHRLEGWVGWCDRLVVLDRGRVLADGPVDAVLAQHRAALLAAGVWVPGADPPEPLAAFGPLGPRPGPASGQRVNHRPRLPSRDGKHWPRTRLEPRLSSRDGKRWPSAGPGPAALVQRRQTRAGADSGAPLPPRDGERVPGLRLRGVQPADPGGAPLLAAPVDLDLAPGGAAALVGPSGVGKSSLLGALTGLRAPLTGEVLVTGPDGGRPVTVLARSSRALGTTFGWLPQQAETMITRTSVRAEVLATAEAVHAGDPERLARARSRAAELLDVLGLGGLAGADPHALSGGEQRRMALAAALAHEPAVLLLDEPTVGQDRHTWAAVAGLVGAARAAGTVVVATTHDPLLAAALGGPVVLRPAPTRVITTVPDHRVRPVLEPGAPPAARANPLALLAVALGAAVGSFGVSSATVGLLTLLVTVLLSPLAVRRPRPALLRLVPVGLAALSVGWSTLLFGRYGVLAPAALPVAGAEVTRILCLVVPGALLVGAVRPSGLGDALAQRLHLPHRPVVAGTAALLRLDGLLDTWRRLDDVRRVRGLAPGRSPIARARHLFGLTLALLVGVLRSSQQTALSMDARGFAGARHRTFALPSPWSRVDLVCLAVAVLLAVLPWVLTAALA